MLACFQFSDEEVAEFSPQVISEIERQLLGSFKTWTLRALLPLLQQRAERFYRFKGLSPEDAKDLSGGFVEKVLDQLSKNFPHGNVGTWIVMIRWSIFVDYLRRKSREREHFGAQQEPEWFAKVPDPLDDEGALELRAFMEELPVEQRDVLDRLREGQKWSEIAEYYQTKTAELRKDLQSLKWPEGSVPLRKNRRRRDPNA
jgi:DNA-directed RNA polymerase specialized sigma24 family protein